MIFRNDKSAWSRFEQPQAGPKGGGHGCPESNVPFQIYFAIDREE